MLVAGCGNSSKADTVVNTYDVTSEDQIEECFKRETE